MKVIVDCNDTVEEEKIVITCRQVTDNILKIVALANSTQKKLVGSSEHQMHLIQPSEVYYIESVDDKVFICTKDKLYDCALKLYEIEKEFAHTSMMRASKSTIINLSRVRSLNPMLNGKIEVVFDNGEKQLISRQYAPVLKARLGIKR